MTFAVFAALALLTRTAIADRVNAAMELTSGMHLKAVQSHRAQEMSEVKDQIRELQKRVTRLESAQVDDAVVELQGISAEGQSTNTSASTHQDSDISEQRRVQSSAACPTASVLAQWAAQGLTLAEQKGNGRAYVTCANDINSRKQKVSCLPEECGDEPWCFVENGCGSWLFSCTRVSDVALQCPPHSGPHIETPHSKTKITLAVDVDWPPYAFFNVGEAGPSGGLTGFGKDFGEGMADACGLDITFVQTNWENCWDPDGYKPNSPGIGKGLLNHWFDGCSTYTHAQGVRNRFVEFTNSILDANKPAGLLTLLREDGTPKVDGLESLAGRKVVDVGGWVPTADGLLYVKNQCTGQKYAPRCVDPEDIGCYTLLVGDGNDAAMKMLRSGEADAMFVYADQAYNYECDANGKTHSGADPTWDCELWKGFGTEYAYVQTGQFGHAINGTTLALAPKGSGLAELLNPCIQSFLKTKAYYDLCVKYDMIETCYPNEFFPRTVEKRKPYMLPTNQHTTGCTDGYCSCPSYFNTTGLP